MSSQASSTVPEHLLLMDDSQKWAGLINLLQSQRDQTQHLMNEIQSLKFETTRLADEVSAMAEKLDEAEKKLSKVEEIRLMAVGGKAALLAAGGAIVWILNHALDLMKNNGK